MQRRALLDLWLAAVLEELTSRGAKRPVLIAYKALVPELRAHPALAAWCAEDPARTVRFAHYGALRGSNRFRRRDAVVTLGDPWLNGDDVTGRAEWLALDEPSYRIALATAELGQAHGRSRSVRRRVAITLLHVGRLVPDGWSAGAHVEPLGGPPERSRGAADRIEFGALVVALGGNRGAAVRLGYKPSALANWRSGRRGLPREALDRARDLVTDAVKPSDSSGEAGRGAPVLEMDTAAYREIISSRVHASASPAEEAVVATSGDEFTAASGFSEAPLDPETNESSPSLRVSHSRWRERRSRRPRLGEASLWLVLFGLCASCRGGRGDRRRGFGRIAARVDARRWGGGARRAFAASGHGARGDERDLRRAGARGAGGNRRQLSLGAAVFGARGGRFARRGARASRGRAGKRARCGTGSMRRLWTRPTRRSG